MIASRYRLAYVHVQLGENQIFPNTMKWSIIPGETNHIFYFNCENKS